jgi:hypothetical protein
MCGKQSDCANLPPSKWTCSYGITEDRIPLTTDDSCSIYSNNEEKCLESKTDEDPPKPCCFCDDLSEENNDVCLSTEAPMSPSKAVNYNCSNCSE